MGKHEDIFGAASKDKVSSKADKTRKGDLSADAAGKSNRGRPAGHAGGKRSDPDYTQKLVYLKGETIEAADTKLRGENKERSKQDRRDFSDLVQTLLEKWLKS